MYVCECDARVCVSKFVCRAVLKFCGNGALGRRDAKPLLLSLSLLMDCPGIVDAESRGEPSKGEARERGMGVSYSCLESIQCRTIRQVPTKGEEGTGRGEGASRAMRIT